MELFSSHTFVYAGFPLRNEKLDGSAKEACHLVLLRGDSIFKTFVVAVPGGKK
jgi:hypothetical protein